MAVTHILGMPRIGPHRELKKALEDYWAGKTDEAALKVAGKKIREANWAEQNDLDWVTVGDFSFYDHVLDMSALLGVIPLRVPLENGKLDLESYFLMARGKARGKPDITACEMTKWFDTNYHYIVPELDENQQFKVLDRKLFEEIEEAQQLGYNIKPILLGPLTYLWLGKTASEDFDKLKLLDPLAKTYQEIFEGLKKLKIEWVQIDEPILALDLPSDWKEGFRRGYAQLKTDGLKILLTTYFGELGDNVDVVKDLPVDGVHIDVVKGNIDIPELSKNQILSVGIVDGRNIWRNNLRKSLEILKPLYKQFEDRLWIGSSCSLLHSPLDLNLETLLDDELKSWLAFAKQKVDEIGLLSNILKSDDEVYANEIAASEAAFKSRNISTRIHNPIVQKRCQDLKETLCKRSKPFAQRYPEQCKQLKLPRFPTTTIGSFPQTHEIRHARFGLKSGSINEEQYKEIIREEIQYVIKEQENLGIDVLVHGEVERSDMVEFFGEKLDGFALTENGWVQSYGSRYVRPPIIYGDIYRGKAMTVEWIKYAQSLTKKPVKGILTGPITMLHWSFMRDDLHFFDVANQIGFALRDEVQDLEDAGIKVIQIDEPAFREALPLRNKDWKDYLEKAVRAFRIASCGVQDLTQVHTHMCYSKFNDIFDAIIGMDADVITIESFRSNMEILKAFEKVGYPNAIGPGVYDIHSPRVPSVEEIRNLLERAVKLIHVDRLWVNPDCGLKTRYWPEVRESLLNMIDAAKELRIQS